MTRIEFWDPAGEITIPGKGTGQQVFAQDAFDGTIGRRVPMKDPSGRQAGWATVISVVVDNDGGGATWTVDLEDRVTREAEEILRHGTGRFVFHIPGEDLPRDPLETRPPVIRWRDPS